MNTLWMILTGITALVLGRSMLIWGALGYIVGWPVMLVIWLFGPKSGVWERRLDSLQDFSERIEKLEKPKEYKDFDTVDDLFKQLESK